MRGIRTGIRGGFRDWRIRIKQEGLTFETRSLLGERKREQVWRNFSHPMRSAIVYLMAMILTFESICTCSAAEPQDFRGGIMDFVPTAEELGEEWTRQIEFLMDADSKPSEYPALPQAVRDTQRTNAVKMGRTGTVMLEYRRTEFPKKHFGVGLSRYKDTDAVNRVWQGLLASPIQHKPVEALGERALIFGEIFQIAPPQGNPPTVWFARGQIVVWVTLFGGSYEKPNLEVPKRMDEKIQRAMRASDGKKGGEP